MGPITKQLRLHQMKDDRWTLRDKASQFRGLINLYTRDRKQILDDTQKTVGKNWKLIRQLTSDIVYYRKRFDNALSDKQRVRNALANYQLYLKAYEHLHPQEIVANIDHKNFAKAKLINNVSYKLRNRERLLHKLQLEIATLQDRIKADSHGENRRSEQVLINKINNMNIRQNTAATIRFNYERILEILKKDAFYYDTVLTNLRQDQVAQCKCIFRATEMGQLATEDLDNLRRDYRVMERTVKADMRMRDKQVATLRDEVTQMTTTCKLLTRSESDTVVNILDNKDKQSVESDVPKELEELEAILKQLQEVTCVPSFTHIFPRMQKQLSEKMRISKQLHAVTRKRDTLQNTQKHAVAMIAHLEHTDDECNKEFEESRQELLDKIKRADDEQETVTADLEDIAQVLLTIRFSLQTLEQQLERVKDPNEDEYMDNEDSDEEGEEEGEGDEDGVRTLNSDMVIISAAADANAEHLLSLVQNKLKLLSTQLYVHLDEKQNEKAKSVFEQQIVENQSVHLSRIVDEEPDSPLVLEHEIEDPQVMTRDGVKSRSTKIVEWFERPLEIQLMEKMNSALKSKK